MQPGRACPLDYRYSPEAVGAAAPLDCEALYVIGGLYGNVQALATILELAEAEQVRPTLVFNGDFHWFDVDVESFERVNEAVQQHVALRGNVETELASESAAAGCGCGYPEWVGDAEVERSNAIMERLRTTARRQPERLQLLGALPMYGVGRVAGLRVGLVHGDLESLAGWGYAQETLAHRAALAANHCERADVRVIASSHTCLPVMAGCGSSRGPCALVNNGAAGMPNFRGSHYGVITRIAATPARDPLYGLRVGPLHVDAIAVRYDHAAWVAAFLANWPEGSPAHRSYFGRITEGPSYERNAALRMLQPAPVLP